MPKKDGLKVKGFFRVNIEEDGKIVGDSGVFPNMVTNAGLEKFCAYTLCGSAGSLVAASVALGSGSAVGSADATINGDILAASAKMASFSAKAFAARSASAGSCTLSLQGIFQSTDSFVTAQKTLNCIGLGNSATGAYTLFCHQTFASSTISTNQNVNFTYELRIG